MKVRVSTCAAISCGVMILASCGSNNATSAGRTSDAPLLALTEEVRIGGATDANTAFSRIGGVAVDAAGSVYAYDPEAFEIRVFDAKGTYTRTLGGRGTEPGKFSGQVRFGISSDTVWVVDLSSRRLTLFSTSGTLLLTSVLPLIEVPLQPTDRRGAGIVLPAGLDADGYFYSDMLTFIPEPSNASVFVGAGDTVHVPRIRYDRAGTVVDTAGWDHLPPPPPSQISVTYVGSHGYAHPRPVTTNSVRLTVDRGTFFLDADSLSAAGEHVISARLVASSGDTVFQHTYLAPAVPYSEEALDEIAWAHSRLHVAGGTGPRDQQPDSQTVFSAIRSAMEFPPVHPPFSSTAVTAAGEIWFAIDGGDPAQQEWAIVSRSGVIRARALLPSGTNLAAVAQGQIWVVMRDSSDIPWLVRYSVR